MSEEDKLLFVRESSGLVKEVGTGMAVSGRNGSGIHDNSAAAEILKGHGGGHMEGG